MKISLGNGKWKWGSPSSSDAQLLGVDEKGLETWHHFDRTTGKTHIEYAQDVQPILEHCHALRASTHSDIGVKQSFMHAAIIPDIVAMIWKKKYGLDNLSDPAQMKKAKALLNTEFKKFKVTDRKL